MTCVNLGTKDVEGDREGKMYMSEAELSGVEFVLKVWTTVHVFVVLYIFDPVSFGFTVV